MLSSSFQNPFSFKTKFIILAKGFSSKIVLDPETCCVVPDGGVVCLVVEKPIYPPMFSKIPLEVFAVNVGDSELMITLDSGTIVTLQPGQMVTSAGQVMLVKPHKGLLDTDGFSIFMCNESYHHREGIYGDDKPSVVFGPLDTEGLMRGVTSFELMRDLQKFVPGLSRPFDALEVLQLIDSHEMHHHFSSGIHRAMMQLLEIKHVYGYGEGRRLIKSDLTGQANCALGLDDLKFFIQCMEHALWMQLDFDHFERELNKLTVDQADFAIQAFAETNPMTMFKHDPWVNTFNTFSAEMYLKGGTEWLNACLGECVRKPFKPSIQQNQLWTPNFQPQFSSQPMQMPMDQSRMYQPPSHNMPPQQPMPGVFPTPGMPFGQIQHPHFPMGHNLNPHRPQF